MVAVPSRASSATTSAAEPSFATGLAPQSEVA